MISIAKKLALVAIAGYIAVCAMMWAGQRSYLYYPNESRNSPADVGLADVSEIVLHTDEGHQLYSWWHEPDAGELIVLFFHGNGGNISGRASRYAGWIDQGFGFFVLGYPGYGGSGGSPSEDSISAASELAWNWLSEQGFGGKDIVIYGESLGSAVAVKLAANNRSRALVLEAPMTSVREIAESNYPWLPVSLLLQDAWLSSDYISDVGSPLLVMHGDRDRLIPIENGRSLFEAAADPKEFHVVRGAGHNDLSHYRLAEQVERFLQRYP